MAKKRKRDSRRRVPQPAPPPPKRRRMWLPALAAAAALGGVVGIVALVSDFDGERRSVVTPASERDDPGPIHVHGLGINPSDRALFIATHTGLFRVESPERKAERVGESRQDTMGFTVVGGDHFLGSGHPDVPTARAKGWPPHLGLIESRDAGRTWRSVSLLGEADFHVLRSVRGRVYGFDVTGSRLLVSRDAGKAWHVRNLPGFLVDLVAHPRVGGRLIASTPQGLMRSSDDGRTWKRGVSAAGLLAWPTPKRLYLVGGDGAVLTSADGGRDWTARGSVAGQPAALLAEGDSLFVALHDGTVKQSGDGGRSWTIRSSP